ncbi:hypothetical protein KEM55_002664 [Ascosphaera atra]|nr:hypothetical protein KEM55_002664 [Ascosphaera atra]
MDEISFCKTFLSAVDVRPVKIPSTHSFDPFQFEIHNPYTLPRLNEQRHPPMPKKRKIARPPGAAKSIDVNLKSARNPPLEVTLTNADISTLSVEDLKEEVQCRVENKGAMVPLDKIKILWKRKPTSGKMIHDVIGDEATTLANEGGSIEFGVMVLGGATVRETPLPRPTRKETQPAPISTEETKAQETKDDVQMRDVSQPPESEALSLSEAFWQDLDGFLKEKLKAEDAAKVKGIFRSAWEKKE